MVERNHRVCWYLQGNQTIPGRLSWCKMDFAHLQYDNFSQSLQESDDLFEWKRHPRKLRTNSHSPKRRKGSKAGRFVETRPWSPKREAATCLVKARSRFPKERTPKQNCFSTMLVSSFKHVETLWRMFLLFQERQGAPRPTDAGGGDAQLEGFSGFNW